MHTFKMLRPKCAFTLCKTSHEQQCFMQVHPSQSLSQTTYGYILFAVLMKPLFWCQSKQMESWYCSSLLVCWSFLRPIWSVSLGALSTFSTICCRQVWNQQMAHTCKGRTLPWKFSEACKDTIPCVTRLCRVCVPTISCEVWWFLWDCQHCRG